MSDISNNAIVDVDFDTPLGKLHIHYDDNDSDKEKDDSIYHCMIILYVGCNHTAFVACFYSWSYF